MRWRAAANMSQSPRIRLPSIDALLQREDSRALLDAHGRALAIEALRSASDAERARQREAGAPADGAGDRVAADAAALLDDLTAPPLRAVLNLTGTVLHTNLGRAPLPPEAIDAMTRVASGASNLEYDLASGKRGDRDSHLERWLCRLTGAEAATVVNNNAAAVLLMLSALASRRQVVVSRGELVEIGGAFRIPDIMKRATAKLVEVGTTNRTHAYDYENAIGPQTAALMKVHTSNYAVVGFTKAVAEAEMADIAHRHSLPCLNDLGCGTLVDLARFGLPHEPTPDESIRDGVDVVSFSGDKLLGGPQCGIIVGKREYIARIKKHPLKRALRLDKLTIAALGAVLPLYGDPDRLVERLPTLRQLSRDRDELRAQARRLSGPLGERLGDACTVDVVDTDSQVGSGALPLAKLPSAAVAMTPTGAKKAARQTLARLEARFRDLPTPVIGRLSDGVLLLDPRCLEEDALLLGQLHAL